MAFLLQIFGSVIAISILFRMFQRYRKLREIPGPFITSITDLWRFRIQYSGPVLPTLVGLHRKYGSVVRIGPNSVSVSSPEYVKNIYTNRGEFKKADSYHPTKAFVNGKSVGSIIDMQDEEQNRALKRAVGGYSSNKHQPISSGISSPL